MSHLISIIVPVYNVERYLKECVDSLLNQKFKDYEVILVNDGSTDKSGEICDSYAEQFPYVHVIHKRNGGLSDARNTGLGFSSGKYILFVDSDDYISKGSLDSIVEVLDLYNKYIDVAFLESIKFYPDGKSEAMSDGYISNLINNQSKDVVMKHLSSINKFPGSACTKLTSRDLIYKHDLFFQTGLLSEDIDWTIRLLKVAEHFAYVDTPYYFYRQKRAGSITNSVNLCNIECLLSIIEKWSSENLGLQYQYELNSFMAYEYMIVLFNYANLSKHDKSEIYGRVKNNSWLLSYSNSRKTKIVKLVYKCLGLTLTSKLLAIYKH